jgi:hypothetical protein
MARERKPTIKPDMYVCACGKKTGIIMLTKSGHQIPVCKQCMPSSSKAMKNPRRVMIYSDVIRIIARKGQSHICDAECKRKDHTYYHDFTPGSKIYGLPDKSLLIKG